MTATSGRAVRHLIVTGQSLSIGSGGNPVLQTTQPFFNLMLNTAQTSLPCLTDASLGIERPGTSAANSLTHLSPGQTRQMAMTSVGVGSTSYYPDPNNSTNGLRKGTVPYQNSLTAVTNTRSLVLAMTPGRTYGVDAVMVVHGEHDWERETTGATYKGYLEEWQRDYEADLFAITGQAGRLPLFTDQMHTWTKFSPQRATPTMADGSAGVTLGQWHSARDNPTRIFLVGPKYQYPYSDGRHLTNRGYQMMGQMFGKAMRKVLVDGVPWRPVAPRAITRNGSVVSVRFWVPAGSLVFDTTIVAARANMGFEFAQTGGNTVTITGVSIAAGDTVQITLSATPTGTSQRVRYAYRGTVGASGGASGAAAGNLRDNDPTVGVYGDALYDWGITFDEPVGFAWEPNTSTGARLGGGTRLVGKARVR